MMFRPSFAAWLLVIALAACSLPPPYQTYSPGTAAPPPPPATTALATPMGVTSAANVDQPETAPEPVPTPAPIPIPSASGQLRIAICYNRLWNAAAAVRSAATEACGNYGKPQVVSQDLNLDACPLLTPTRAVFACVGGTHAATP